jgi:hypothetical protein
MRTCSGVQTAASVSTPTSTATHRSLVCSSGNLPYEGGSSSALRRTRPAHDSAALRDARHDRQGDRQLRVTSPRARRPIGHPLFSDDALALIHQVSRGLPRAGNNLAIPALVAAYAGKRAIVDESSARAGVAEVTAE